MRSAEVNLGPSLMLQTSITTPPQDEVGWLFLYCSIDCDRPIPGTDVAFTLAAGGRDGPGIAAGLGANGGLQFPYVDGYIQIGSGERPFGVGGRLGLSPTGWEQHQLYGRYDFILDDGRRILLNPGVFLKAGASPNGAHRGQFVAFTQGVGYLVPGKTISYIPAASLVVGRLERESYGDAIGPLMTGMLTVSVGVIVHTVRKE